MDGGGWRVASIDGSVGCMAPAMRQRGQSPPGAPDSRTAPQESQKMGSGFMSPASCRVGSEWLHTFLASFSVERGEKMAHLLARRFGRVQRLGDFGFQQLAKAAAETMHGDL